MERFTNISGVIVTGVFTAGGLVRGWSNKAVTKIYLNPQARYPVDEATVASLSRVDLNKWKFGHPLKQTEPRAKNRLRSSEAISISSGQGDGFELEISGATLASILAGSADLISLFGDQPSMKLAADIENGFTVTGCESIPANIEQGLPVRFKLFFSPPEDDVFWPYDRPDPVNQLNKGGEQCS